MLAPRSRSNCTSPQVNWHVSGSGEPLILISGWTASGLLWPTAWLRKLERRFRVIRIDNRGTGWSRNAQTPFSIADMAHDVRAVMGACGVEQATVLGLSMGGMIAQELAIRHPGTVRGLVLVGTRPPTPAHIPSDYSQLFGGLNPPPAGLKLSEYFRRMWGDLCAPGFAAENPDVLDEIVARIMRRPTPRSGVLHQLRAAGGWHRPDRLANLDVPTTVVHGDCDPLMPVGNGMRLAKLIPGAQYLELPGIGHLPPFEAGAELESILEASLDE